MSDEFDTTPGGRYRVGGKLVDANGEELKGTAAKTDDANDSDSGGGALDGVDFASEAAREAAREAGLTAADFKGVSPSGASGFTKPDVGALAAAKLERQEVGD